MMHHAAEDHTYGPASQLGAPQLGAPQPGPSHDSSQRDTQRSNAPQSALGPVKEVVVTLVAAYGQPTLETALAELAEQTAFDLVELRPASDGLLDRWHAHFRLRAPRGVVGDAQIYDLLRNFAGELRWVEIGKLPLHDIPTHLA